MCTYINTIAQLLWFQFMAYLCLFYLPLEKANVWLYLHLLELTSTFAALAFLEHDIYTVPLHICSHSSSDCCVLMWQGSTLTVVATHPYNMDDNVPVWILQHRLTSLPLHPLFIHFYFRDHHSVSLFLYINELHKKWSTVTCLVN